MDLERREPQFNKEKKPSDWLPSGQKLEEYKEWTSLEKRIGKPRIEQNPFFGEFLKKIEGCKENPEALSFFEAGCGHGNDLRIVKRKYLDRGIKTKIFGVDYSEAELERGLEFYEKGDERDRNFLDMQKLLAQGDLTDLNKVKVFDEKSQKFSKEAKIPNNTFGIIYCEAVLHALGMGKGSYREKKANAFKMLKELNRIAKPGAMFFGRASVFGPDDQGKTLNYEEQLKFLRDKNEWRFFPTDKKEFEKMLEESGLRVVQTETEIRDSKARPERKNVNRVTFYCLKSK